MNMSLAKQVMEHIEAGVQAVWITSHEEERVLEELQELINGYTQQYRWSSARYLYDSKTGAGLGNSMTGFTGIFPAIREGNQGILVLLDAHHALAAGSDTGLNVRAFREFLQTRHSPVIIISSSADYAPELSKLISKLDFK